MESPAREALQGPNPSPSPPPSGSFFPATPSLQYRSVFSEECEALALRVAEAARPTPPPFGPLRLPSTIEAETLTPLWTDSILNETFTQTPAPPPPPSSPNRTFCCEGNNASALEATYSICGEASARSSGLYRTFEEEAAPLVTSTPAPLGEEMNARAGIGRGLLSEEGGCSQGGASTKKRRLSPGSRSPGCPAPKKTALRGKGAPGKASGGKPKEKEAAGVARPNLGKKQLPSGMKTGLAEVPQEKKSALSAQLHSHLARKPPLGSSVAHQVPKLQEENKPSRTKLPVPAAGGPKTSKMGVQKPPKEKELKTESNRKQPIAKSLSQSADLDGRRTGGALMPVGQIPRDAPGHASCLQCQRLLQENQLLAEEIQHLKTLLESYQGTSS
ncbi:uncharacterized protein [Anolis sagrei]|uniref:uncharacterized protein n=1 Tax=Anolis sagrei TaxID=38937 RepID=UPI003520543F